MVVLYILFNILFIALSLSTDFKTHDFVKKNSEWRPDFPGQDHSNDDDLGRAAVTDVTNPIHSCKTSYTFPGRSR